MAQPNMPNISEMIKAGINPVTGLPYKMSGGSKNHANLANDMNRLIRIMDEQDATTRFTWFNVPMNLSSQEIERMLYYRGTLAFFMLEDRFYLMPYALDGTMDFYGRYNTIHPVPMNDNAKEAKKTLSQAKRDVVYGILDEEEIKPSTMERSAVILNDYTPQMAYSNIIARQILNDPICQFESDCFAYMNTAMMTSTGVRGVRVQDEDSKDDIIEGANSVSSCAKGGTPWVPIMGSLEFQDFGDGATYKTEDYLISMQAIDNFRKYTYGLNSGGLIDKQNAYVNKDQVAINSGSTAPLTDGLLIRQNFCNIVNSIWGLGIWCEISETASGADKNGDMIADDSGNNTGGGNDDQGTQPKELQ